MPYPSKNPSTYTSPTKNSATSTNSTESGQDFLSIGEGYILMIDSNYSLLLENNSVDWSYATKS